MSEFIGRDDELYELRRLRDEGRSIIRIGGRKGVGKTALATRFCSETEGAFFTAMPLDNGHNMRELSKTLGLGCIPDDVRTAIDIIDRTMVGGVIVVDDATRLDGIDGLECRNVTLILVDRSFADPDLLLEPFGLRETGLFFPDCMPREKLLIYSVTGGVASYMMMFDRNLSVSDNIERLFFDRNGRLYDEPVNLLKAMGIREVRGYISLMLALTEGVSTVNGIVRATDQHSTASVVNHLTPLLGTLVERRVPLGRSRAEYRLSDYMMRFWLIFVLKRMSEIGCGRRYVFADIDDDSVPDYLSQVFRESCARYVQDGYGVATDAWIVDDVGTSFMHCMDDRNSYFISCTWSNRPSDLSDLERLRRFSGRRSRGKDRTYIMFSSTGFIRELESVSENEDIDLVSLEGMFW